MAKKRGRNTNKKSLIQWWMWVIALTVAWLIGSSYMQKSPTQMVSDLYRNLLGQPTKYLSPEQQSAATDVYKDSLRILHHEISELKNRSPYRKALVDTDATSLNLRSASNLNSDVVIKIPDSSIIEVIYFDEEVLVLDGEAGKWCKIRYADKEGWVWGNYVKIID